MVKLKDSHRLMFFRFSETEKDVLTSFLIQSDLKLLNSGLNLIKIKNDSEDERLIVRSIINNNPNPFFLFSEEKSVAELAWESDSHYFINLSSENWIKKFEKGFRKQMKSSLSVYKQKISFKSHQRIDFVFPDDIIFVIANGNYSSIHCTDNRKIMVTKQLGQIESVLSNWDNLERFGKSTIINLNKVKSIVDKTILFTNDTKLCFPKYSKSFIYLKKRLIWA